MIPLTNAKVCEMLNLDAKLAGRSVFTSHQKSVLAYLKKYTTSESYNDAISEDPTDEDLVSFFEMAFALIMLNKTADFLNLNTAGTGIVKKTGFDNQSVELLSGRELESFKKKLEKRALTELETYLNISGKRRLSGFNANSSKFIRAACLI